MRHICSNSDLGELTEISLHWWQVNTGVSYSLLKHPANLINYTGDDWFSFVQEFLNALKVSLDIPSLETTIPITIHKKDRFIMDDIEKLNLTKTETTFFNNVRLCMKMYFLSKICTADGSKITRESWTGNHIHCTNQLWHM